VTRVASVGSRRYYDGAVVVVRMVPYHTGGDHIHAGVSSFVLEVITSTGGVHIHDGVSLFVVEVITSTPGGVPYTVSVVVDFLGLPKYYFSFNLNN
jgi:hypothetical protein